MHQINVQQMEAFHTLKDSSLNLYDLTGYQLMLIGKLFRYKFKTGLNTLYQALNYKGRFFFGKWLMLY